MEKKVFLRVLEPSDIDRVYKWHNDTTLYQTLVGRHHYVSRSTVEKWLAQKGEFSHQEISLAICLIDTQEHIGNIYLKDIDPYNRHAFLHILIGDPEHRQKGFGFQAVSSLLDYAFNKMGLHRIGLHLLSDNYVALKFYKKCGFLLEGTMKKHVFKDGVFKNVVIMGICRDDYLDSQASDR